MKLNYVKISKERIEEESLKSNQSRGSYIYIRKYARETDRSIITYGSGCLLSKADRNALEINTLNNATVLATLSFLNIEGEGLREHRQFFQNNISNVRRSETSLADKLRTNNPAKDAMMKRMLLKLLKDVGTNIVDYCVDDTSVNIEDIAKSGAPKELVEALRKQFPSGEMRNRSLRFIHSTEHNGTRSLDSGMESLGTISIVRLLVVLYDIVTGKKTTCIDEIETGIHTTALDFILEMYLTIAEDCQIVVATHNLSLLKSDYIRRDAIRKFTKDEDGVTTVKRQGYIHNTVNLYKKYKLEIQEATGFAKEDKELLQSYLEEMHNIQEQVY